jgi:hypothetical protein
VRFRLLVACGALAVALVAAGHASAFTKTGAVVVMDDGAAIATSLYLPDGPQPTAGRPGIVMLPGLGGKETTAIPAGSRLSITFGSSTSGTAGGLLDLDLQADGASRLTIGAASLTLPVLVKPVSS